MSRVCTVCASALAGAIDEQLRSGRAAQSVATEFAVGQRSMQRHAKAHLNRTVAIAAGDNSHLNDDPLDELVDALRTRALAGDPVVAREYRLALSAQAAAQHAAAPTRHLASEAEWIALRSRLLVALELFPEARWAVVDALADA